MHYAQLVQSHALSFFLLSGPDLLLGMESDPAKRNLIGLIETQPELAREGIRLRQFGQEIIRLLGDRAVHPSWAVSGGVRESLTADKRDWIATRLPEALATAKKALTLGYEALQRLSEEADCYGNFPSLFLGLVSAEGGLEQYDGKLRLIDAEGRNLEGDLDPCRYADFIGEAEQSWSYLKFPYYKPRGHKGDAGMYRVGPLARLNVADYAGTPLAELELKRFRQFREGGGPVLGSFYFHQARLIELLYCLERIGELLDDPQLLDEHVRSHARTNNQIGIGVVEAPRGVLFHEYHVDEQGLLSYVNLVIATGQNNLAMNRTVLQIAQKYLSGSRLDEGLLNRVEHGIRCYDPCLSCSTHAVGKMPVQLELLAFDGSLMQRLSRSS